MAEWLGKGLQNPVPRFDSGCRLSDRRKVRAISSGGERFLDAEEVSGSNPLSPTLKLPANQKKTEAPAPSAGGFVQQPCSNASSARLIQHLLQGLDRLLLNVREQVRVDIQCDADRGVTKHLGDYLGVDVLRE